MREIVIVAVAPRHTDGGRSFATYLWPRRLVRPWVGANATHHRHHHRAIIFYHRPRASCTTTAPSSSTTARAPRAPPPRHLSTARASWNEIAFTEYTSVVVPCVVRWHLNMKFLLAFWTYLSGRPNAHTRARAEKKAWHATHARTRARSRRPRHAGACCCRRAARHDAARRPRRRRVPSSRRTTRRVDRVALRAARRHQRSTGTRRHTQDGAETARRARARHRDRRGPAATVCVDAAARARRGAACAPDRRAALDRADREARVVREDRDRARLVRERRRLGAAAVGGARDAGPLPLSGRAAGDVVCFRPSVVVVARVRLERAAGGGVLFACRPFARLGRAARSGGGVGSCVCRRLSRATRVRATLGRSVSGSDTQSSCDKSHRYNCTIALH